MSSDVELLPSSLTFLCGGDISSPVIVGREENQSCYITLTHLILLLSDETKGKFYEDLDQLIRSTSPSDKLP